MSCLYEPIHGRFPTRSLCDSYPDCVGCGYSDPFKQPKQTNANPTGDILISEAEYEKLSRAMLLAMYMSDVIDLLREIKDGE